MTLDDFKKIDIAGRGERSKIFESVPPSPPATESEIDELETLIGVKVSRSFREFLINFGGGDYGLTAVFCADNASEWYLPRQLQEISLYLPGGLLPIVNDFTGGIYCQQIENKEAKDKVWYWNTDGGIEETDCADVFELVGKIAY